MSNILSNWWRSYQFSRALQRGEQKQVHKLWIAIESSGAKLNWLEKLYKSNREANKRYKVAQEELSSLRLQITESSQQFQELELLHTDSSQHIRDLEVAIATASKQIQHLEASLQDSSQQIQQLESELKAVTTKSTFHQKPNLIVPNPDFITFISNTFKFVHHDEYLLQVTGLDHQVFDKFEASLARFIKDDFTKISKQPNFQLYLDEAIIDIKKLRSGLGLDPSYNLRLSPHVYFITYFLEGVYSSYLAWFLVYKSGLLTPKINILDIAAGSSSVEFGLELFLESGSDYFDSVPIHISYYSVEQQSKFQDKGIEFRQKYLESKKQNAYFRFDASSIFDADLICKLPKTFFDFIVISHCFFNNKKTRQESQIVYREIIDDCLSNGGYVLLVIQDNALLKPYGFSRKNNISIEQEEEVIKKFVSDFGLSLNWYKYLSSKNTRGLMSPKDFAVFAQKNLPFQNFISPLLRQYTDQKYTSNYTLDDYVILARK